jgi:hypothetical protein
VLWGLGVHILCLAGRHRTAASGLWNNGYYFSYCERCNAPLIRSGVGHWKAVPRGLKIVWKTRTDGDIDWNAWEREQAAIGHPYLDDEAASSNPSSRL